MFNLSEYFHYDFKVKTINEPEEDLLPGKIKLYLYTNTLNLLKFLSSGVIFPQIKNEESEYPDISTTNRKGIILFKDTISYENCLEIWKDDLNLPVCILVNIPFFLNDCKIIDKEYLGRSGKPDGLKESDIALFLPGCIPLSLVDSINFRETRQLEQFLNKRSVFNDVPFDLIKSKISPDLFGNTKYDLLTLNALINTFQIPIDVFNDNHFVYYKKFFAFFSCAFDFAVQTKNPELFLNFMKLLFLLPGKDVKELKKRYKTLKDAGIDFENFTFSDHFYLLLPLITIKYSGDDINLEFEKFINDFLGKKSEPEELIKIFFNFASFRLLINTEGESSEIKNEFFTKIQDSFLILVKKTKKVTKKVSEKYILAFQDVTKIKEYEKEIETIKEWGPELNPIKHLILLGFNDDYERAKDLRKEKDKYALTEIDIFKISLYAALFSGINNLHQKYKSRILMFSGIDSVLIDILNCGLKYYEKDYLPTLKERKTEEDKKIFEIDGAGNLQIIIEQKEEENELVKLIKTGGLPTDQDLLLELAEKLGLENEITTEIIFEGTNLDFSLKEQSRDNITTFTIISNTRPKLIHYHLDGNKLINFISMDSKRFSENKIEKEFLDKIRKSQVKEKQ